MNWIESQKRYIESLNEHQKNTITDFTDDGHELLKEVVLNTIDWDKFYSSIKDGRVHFYELIIYKIHRLFRQQGSHTTIEIIKSSTDSIPKNVYITVIKKIQDDINYIINKAPRTTEEMTLYRGTLDPYFTNKKGEWVSPITVSTSLSEEIAREFMDKVKKCCLKIIKIPKGTRMLYVEPVTVIEEEQEVLLPSGSKFKVKELERGVYELTLI